MGRQTLPGFVAHSPEQEASIILARETRKKVSSEPREPPETLAVSSIRLNLLRLCLPANVNRAGLVASLHAGTLDTAGKSAGRGVRHSGANLASAADAPHSTASAFVPLEKNAQRAETARTMVGHASLFLVRSMASLLD